jgi:hypothetical protein
MTRTKKRLRKPHQPVRGLVYTTLLSKCRVFPNTERVEILFPQFLERGPRVSVSILHRIIPAHSPAELRSVRASVIR